jgi:hypothetical protein
MCDVPRKAVFCRESIECFPGIVSRYYYYYYHHHNHHYIYFSVGGMDQIEVAASTKAGRKSYSPHNLLEESGNEANYCGYGRSALTCQARHNCPPLLNPEHGSHESN